jgi:hypothetical protein
VVSAVDRTEDAAPIGKIALWAYHESIEDTRGNWVDNDSSNICGHNTSSVHSYPMISVVGRTEECAIRRFAIQDGRRGRRCGDVGNTGIHFSPVLSSVS